MNYTWHLGTMGFSYSDWSGSFYPQGMKSQNYLAHYARYFNAVEIDSTFYGTPQPTTITRWKNTTPEAFKFCLKTPREVTHELSLLLPQSLEVMQTFLERTQLLDEKLGMVLLQFPPSFEVPRLGDLEEFIVRLESQVPLAVEFRHASWHKDRAINAIQDLGISWAATDFPRLPMTIPTSSLPLYIRWIGQHGRYGKHTHEREDLTPRLRQWNEVIERSMTPGGTIFGFFNNDYAGFAPGTCNRFKELVGLPAPSLTPPQQGRLF